METISLPTTFLDSCGRLALATLLGAIIGINRELGQKPAGLRTHALVALGAAIVAITSLHLTSTAGLASSDAISRVIQGIVVFAIGGPLDRAVHRWRNPGSRSVDDD